MRRRMPFERPGFRAGRFRPLTLLLAACAVSAVPALAQDTTSTPRPAARGAQLTGVIVDSSGLPIAEVSVGITELRRGTTTDAEGRYEIRSLPPGVYHVTFQRLGFAPEVRRFTLSPGPSTLDVTLEESLIELPATQVTATANATTGLTSPQPTSVLQGDDLRQAQAPTLGETLEHLPGLRSWSTGSGIGKPTIRGLRSDRVVIASNEMRIDNQQWGDEHGSQLETAGIERVEVIRGPASVLYGSDALGGVVNVISRELPTAFGRPWFVTGGTFGGFASVNRMGEGGLTLEGASGGLGWRGNFTARGTGDVRTPGGTLENSENDALTASGAVALRGTRGSVELAYTRRNEHVFIHEDPAGNSLGSPNQKIEEDLGRLSAIVPFGDGSRLEVNLGAERNRRREFELRHGPIVALGLLARTYSGVAHFHHARVGALDGLIGASARVNRFTKFGEESLIPASTGTDAAVFAFEQTELGPWRFAFGARFDHRELDVEDDADLGVTAQTRRWSAVSGNLGVLLRVARPVALVANAGRGFRAPSNFDLFSNGVHEGTVAFEKGDPGLDVETSLNVDVALRVETARVRAEVGGFINAIQDYIHPRPSGVIDPGSGFEVFQTVQGNARLVGFEASAEAHPERHVHVHVSTDFVRGDNLDTDTPLPWIPPMRAIYGVRLEPDPIGPVKDVHVGLEGETVAQQNRLDPLDTTVPAYTLVSASAGGTFPFGNHPIIVDLDVHNLLDEAHRDFMSRFKIYALAPGRNVRVRITTRF